MAASARVGAAVWTGALDAQEAVTLLVGAGEGGTRGVGHVATLPHERRPYPARRDRNVLKVVNGAFRPVRRGATMQQPTGGTRMRRGSSNARSTVVILVLALVLLASCSHDKAPRTAKVTAPPTTTKPTTTPTTAKPTPPEPKLILAHKFTTEEQKVAEGYFAAEGLHLLAAAQAEPICTLAHDHASAVRCCSSSPGHPTLAAGMAKRFAFHRRTHTSVTHRLRCAERTRCHADSLHGRRWRRL